MDYTKLIYDYIEGELQIADEQKLFTELSYNDDLRQEFQNNLKFSNLVQSEVNTVSTPVETTNEVFKSLGFTIPTTQSTGLFGKISKPMLALLIFLITLTGVTGSYFLYDSYFSSENTELSKNNQIPIVNSEETDASNSNEMNSKLNNNSISNSGSSFYLADNLKDYIGNFTGAFGNNDYKNNYSGGYTNNNNSDNDENINDNQFLDNLKIIGFSEFKNMEYNIAYNNQNTNPSQFIFIPMNNSHYKSFMELNEKYSVITNGAINNNYPGIEGLNINNYKSFEIGFWYNLSDKNSIGIELGRQIFSQEFTTNNNINYLQAPQIIFLNASYKRYLLDNEVFGIIMPYSSVSAGGTSIGPLFQIEAGSEIRVTDNLHFLIGAGGNTLFYNVDNKFYNSNNVGIIYGVKFSF